MGLEQPQRIGRQVEITYGSLQAMKQAETIPSAPPGRKGAWPPVLQAWTSGSCTLLSYKMMQAVSWWRRGTFFLLCALLACGGTSSEKEVHGDGLLQHREPVELWQAASSASAAGRSRLPGAACLPAVSVGLALTACC